MALRKMIPAIQRNIINPRAIFETMAPFWWLVTALLKPRAIAALIESQSSILNPVNGSWIR